MSSSPRTRKRPTRCLTDIIVAERIAARSAAEAKLREQGKRVIDPRSLPKIELTNADLPRVVAGRPDDPLGLRPFSSAFNRDKVLKAAAKVGAVPLTRAALSQKKVRKELEPGAAGGIDHGPMGCRYMRGRG